MVTITFDTLKYASKLKAAGVLPEQAEAEAEALSEVFEINLKVLSTQQDLKLLEAGLKRDISETKAELILWMVAVGVLQIAFISAFT
ncbi:MAG: DUF1640 domain-containing protein [Blastocatellia bacterium]